MSDVAEQITENEERAEETFGDVEEKINIPYEPNEKRTTLTLRHYLDHPSLEMPYCKRFVKDGLYKDWIESLQDLQLDSFVKSAEEQLVTQLEKRQFVPPSWMIIQRSLVRKLMYEIEQHRRRFGWDNTIKQKMMSDFASELKSYHTRFENAWAKFHHLESTDSSKAGLPY